MTLESERPENATNSTAAPEAGNSGDDSWKEEYDKLSASWHAESARAREKAELERERWRKIREQEEVAAKLQQYSRKDSEWENVTTSSETGFHTVGPRRGSPSPADVRDLVNGERSRLHESEQVCIVNYFPCTRY